MVTLPAAASAAVDPRNLPIADYFWRRAADGSATSGPVAFAHFEVAAKQFSRFLGRRPVVADLTTEAIERLAWWLLSCGRKPSTANQITLELIRLGVAAFAEGLLDAPPERRRLEVGATPRRLPLSAEEIERLLAVCALESGDVAGVPAVAWWRGLILTIMNTDLSFAAVMAIPRSALNLARSELRAGGLVLWLHPLASELLEQLPDALPDASARLFPWALDAGMPFYHFRRLLRAAGIPHQRGACFDRLRISARAGLTLFDQISLERADRLAGELIAAAAQRERRRTEKKRKRLQAIHSQVPARLRLPRKHREVYAIASSSPRTLRHFFREVYRPRRLLKCSEATLDCYTTVFRRLEIFAGCEVTLDGLAQPGFLEDFMAWVIATGRTERTANKHLAHLLALWRYARRKEYVGGNPDFIDKLTVPKREVECWSIEEFERLLAAAAAVGGDFNGLPYARLLPALLLLIYDAGLRIGAVVQLRSEDFDAVAGSLFCPAEIQKHKMDQRSPVSPQTGEALRRLQPDVREMLFAGPQRRRGEKAKRKDVRNACRLLVKRLRRALRAAGLACTRRDLFHKIRRMSATYVCAAGGEALAISHLGHSGPNVIQAYLDRSKIGRQDVTTLLPRPKFDAAAEHAPAAIVHYVELGTTERHATIRRIP